MKTQCRSMKLNGRSIQTIKGALALFDYRLSGVLGSGAFGTCYLVSRKEEKFVLKVFNKNDVKRRKAKLAREGRFLAALNHPAIPRMIQRLDRDGIYGLIMEKMPGNSLAELISWDYDFSEQEILSITKQLIEIMAYLDTYKISHRDLRAENILWHGGKLSLIDFGSARNCSNLNRRFDPDFWGIGDVFMRLIVVSSEINATGEKHTIEDFAFDDCQKNVVKRLLHVREPYVSIKDLERDFEEAFGRKSCRV